MASELKKTFNDGTSADYWIAVLIVHFYPFDFLIRLKLSASKCYVRKINDSLESNSNNYDVTY